MQQSKLESFIESCINIGSGYFVALFIWVVVVRNVWDIQVSMIDNFTITFMFTVVSVIRSYFWRRFFNAELHKKVHQFVKRYF